MLKWNFRITSANRRSHTHLHFKRISSQNLMDQRKFQPSTYFCLFNATNKTILSVFVWIPQWRSHFCLHILHCICHCFDMRRTEAPQCAHNFYYLNATVSLFSFRFEFIHYTHTQYIGPYTRDFILYASVVWHFSKSLCW